MKNSFLSYTLDLVPTILKNSIIIEIVQYKQKIEEWSPKLFETNLIAKDKKFYEFKLYQTNLLNFICFEYAFNQIENKFTEIEEDINKVIELLNH